MSDLQTYLKEVRKRVDAANEGPWIKNGSNSYYIPHIVKEGDVDFIVNARTDIPRLLEMLEWLFEYCAINKSKDKYAIDKLSAIARGE